MKDYNYYYYTSQFSKEYLLNNIDRINKLYKSKQQELSKNGNSI